MCNSVICSTGKFGCFARLQLFHHQDLVSGSFTDSVGDG